jgi:hypothetical protein
MSDSVPLPWGQLATQLFVALTWCSIVLVLRFYTCCNLGWVWHGSPLEEDVTVGGGQWSLAGSHT